MFIYRHGPGSDIISLRAPSLSYATFPFIAYFLIIDRMFQVHPTVTLLDLRMREGLAIRQKRHYNIVSFAGLKLPPESRDMDIIKV